MSTTRSLVTRVVTALAVLFASVLLGVPAAHAASDADITWSVTPADESGPDKRGVIQQELDPGTSRSDFFAVRNLSRTEVTFALSAADGYYTDTGRFNMLPSDQESVDAGLWIDLPDTVTVGPNGTVVVPFTTTVPEDAIPGDHAAGIAASVTSAGTDADGSQVGVESRVGFRIMTRVTGDIVPSYVISGVGTAYDMSWNPFRPGSVQSTFTVENTGNASLVVTGTAAIGTGSAAFPAEGAPRQELLPGESRAFTVAVADVWPTVFVPGSIDVAPTAVDLGGDPVEVAAQSAPASSWAFPVPQALVLLGVVLIIAALFWRRRRFAAALDRAREEGRVSAGAAGPAERSDASSASPRAQHDAGGLRAGDRP
ncbi:hypothetical protein [Microbacterium enclense]|uniref:DUF916 domain-containing protein n=1 Tax=Microbacterium enclense TaxID=993073 RepID=A0A1G6IZH0_9MICO|nr:hypothetical protein [Microbacterium enclense]KSU54692.1 hypothetical protein AS029_06970 [Microbacterium enclense]SDC11186.1 hypothetical protein SAMN05216418_1649 [Microbacterium enclense]